MSARPTVLVPGLLGSPRLFAEQLPTLWRDGPVTLADTRRGESMAAIAAHILAAAPAEFTLIGLSMGGYLAFEILRQAPGRVARLGLLDTSARPDDAARAQARHDHIALTRAGRFGQVVGELTDRWVRPERRLDPALRRTVRQMAEETGPAAFIRQQTAILARPDSRPGLPAIDCPTLVLVGAQDGLTTPDHAREIAVAVPAARLVVVPDCGHLSTVEQPGAVTAALADWLGQPGR